METSFYKNKGIFRLIMNYIIQGLKKNTKISSILKRTHILFGIAVVTIWLTSFDFNWALENLKRHFPISVTMAFGSLVAGGTALGGGAVAFPVLTKILGIAPFNAKIFSLAIQSIGMTAASVTIICKRISFYPKIVMLSMIGAFPGVLISLIWISDLIPRIAAKSVFSLLLLIFAITLIKTYKTLCSDKISYRYANWLVPSICFFGGITSGLIGSGADVFVFSLLVLYYRVDIKKATATSVIVMAVVSVFASMFNMLVLGTITPEIQQYLHSSIPVVVIGAPLGVWICSRLSNTILLYILLFLISFEICVTGYELLN